MSNTPCQCPSCGELVNEPQGSLCFSCFQHAFAPQEAVAHYAFFDCDANYLGEQICTEANAANYLEEGGYFELQS
jgi:hypothetical protein